ncbi:guanylate kinase [Mariprofundus ferrinatatus]|uniref:Guanylate kinase n=1 Tax=Mariprofundus ferrinatatus TaxID=1921087 RepID=A0A2K8LCR1_9PROT|nr:guanylate kinase [Mariprofundus ferrinatatus]ATX82076.1 guanylate kinase [Mariprofundus ferrinatatus]
MSGRLFIVSGPSGAGKSSLCASLLQHTPDLQLAISCTTRDPRPGEENGREYHFLSIPAFKEQQEAGDFLEWANVHGNLYGTRQSDVEAIMKSGRDVLLEIDWQGAAQVAEKIPTAIRLFILPPSLDELRRRLTSRGQDDIAIVQRRVAAAEAEMAHAGEAHFQIINDDFDISLQRLIGIIQQ